MDKLKNYFKRLFRKYKQEKSKDSFEDLVKGYRKRKDLSEKYLRWAIIANMIFQFLSLVTMLYYGLWKKDICLTIIWGVNYVYSHITDTRHGIYKKIEQSDEANEFLITKVYELQIEKLKKDDEKNNRF